MIWFATGLAVILHVYLWGAGAAYLLLPRRWAANWAVHCPLFGLALQSAVVWIGAHTALEGTESYAIVSLALPVTLLAMALFRLRKTQAWHHLRAVQQWWGLWLVMAFCFAVQLYPLAQRSPVLTSVSLGSCDAADYAAGARVFQEFSGLDRSGFLGQTEVVQLLGIDNFPDYWLYLNHFTPSALLALNGTVFNLHAHELASLFAVLLAVLGLPAVFWLARSAFAMRPLAAALITLLYGISPAVSYAVYHCALGQLIAAPAVALLTSAGVRAFRGPATIRELLHWAGVLLVCNWLILGAYNFFIVFSYIPLLAYVAWETARTRQWRRAANFVVFLALNLSTCALLFPARVLKLAERVISLREHNFGWPIPPFWPSGWYGLFADIRLHPADSAFAQLVAVGCLSALALAIFRLATRKRWQLLGLAGACTLPIFAGYGILVRQAEHSPTSTYDAYKLFAVFLPGILISLCLWLDLPRRVATLASVGRAGIYACLLAASLAMLPMFQTGLGHPRMIVGPSLTRLAKIEAMPQVKSLNVCVYDYWSRLWANYFLLRKPHYFFLPTYEARPPTELRGEWDLRERLLRVQPANPAEIIELNRAFYLIDRRSPTFLDLRFGHGWYPPEGSPAEPACSSGGSPQLMIMNPHASEFAATLHFSARSDRPRRVRLKQGAEPIWEGDLDAAVRAVDGITMAFPPGRTVLEFETPEPAFQSPIDGRFRTLVLHALRIEVAATR